MKGFFFPIQKIARPAIMANKAAKVPGVTGITNGGTGMVSVIWEYGVST